MRSVLGPKGHQTAPPTWCGMTGNESQLQAFTPIRVGQESRYSADFRVLYLTGCRKDGGSHKANGGME